MSILSIIRFLTIIKNTGFVEIPIIVQSEWICKYYRRHF